MDPPPEDQKPVGAELQIDPNQPLRRSKPVYEVESQSGHYGACYKLVQEKRGADPNVYTNVWSNIHNGLVDPYKGVLSTYWMQALGDIQDADHNYKEHQLPLARIKKVMKADPEVKMISAEAPILFAKGCDMFITELTMRAWIHAEENKRRTLQRSDIAAALTKSDMFDFLIDIVPREEATGSAAKRNAAQGQAAPAASVPPAMPPQGQPMAPPQAQHHPQPHEYAQYTQEQHDPYRHAQPMYTPDPAYAHHPQQMPFDPNQAMYPSYGMQPQQMYLQQMAPPRQDHPSAQPQHYPSYDARHHEGDAEGETEDVA